MKIIISNKVLQKALKKIGTVVPKKAILPTLEHIMVTCEGNHLTIKATDLEVTIFYQLTLTENASKDDTSLINFHWLKGISDLHGDEPIYIEALKTYTAITASSGEYRQDASVKLKEFPSLPEVPASESLLMIPNFVKWLNRASVICDLKADIAQWKGRVYLEVINDHLILTATNANQLFTHAFDIESQLNRSMMISHTVVKALDSFADTEMFLSEKSYAFKSGEMTVITKIPEGEFPDYNKIIPKNDVTNSVVDRATLKDTLDKVIFINPDYVTLVPGEDSITLKVKNDNGQSATLTEPLIRGYKGEPMELLVSPTKMQQLLTQTDYEQVGLGFQGVKQALIVTNNKDMAYIGLIMPFAPIS